MYQAFSIFFPQIVECIIRSACFWHLENQEPGIGIARRTDDLFVKGLDPPPPPLTCICERKIKKQHHIDIHDAPAPCVLQVLIFTMLSHPGRSAVEAGLGYRGLACI